MKRRQIGKEKHFWFLVVIILGIFLVSALAVPPVAGANGSPKMTKTTKLEAKLAKIEAGLKQMKSELSQMEKGFGGIKKNLEKKLTEDLKSMDKKLDDLQKMHKSSFLWLVIMVITSLAIALIALVAVMFTRQKNLYQR